MLPASVADVIYGASYRAVRRFLISTGLMDSPLRRWLASLDRSLRRWRLSRHKAEAVLVHGHVFFEHPVHCRAAFGPGAESYEPETTLVWQGLVFPGMTVVDLGAHVGYFTLLACRELAQRGRVYAFEPQPSARELLEKNVAANGYQGIVAVVPKAVSSAAGNATLFTGQTDVAETSLFPRIGVEGSTVEVECTTLDAFFESEGWPSIDIMKMDIEGAERAALQGMPEVSRRNPQLKLIIEFNPECMRAAHVSPEAFFGTLEDRGFIFISLIEEPLRPLHIPADIPWLVRKARCNPLNLLCEKRSN